MKDIVTLTDSDLVQAEELVLLLKPIKTVTTIMCEEKSPTISLIHPMRQRLLSQLGESDGDSVIIKQVRKTMFDDIQSRYADSHIVKFLEICCALDPRFKALPYHNDTEKYQVYESVIRMMLGTEKEVMFESCCSLICS